MTECPQGHCDNIEKLHKSVQEVRTCASKKVNRSTLLTAMLSILGVCGMFTTYAFTANKADKRNINENAKDISCIKIELDHLKDGQKEIKHMIDKMKEGQVTKKEIQDLIKAIKDGK